MPYRSQDIYKGKRKFRTPLLILLFVLAFLVVGAVLAFYGLQQFIVYGEDGVSLEFHKSEEPAVVETVPVVVTPDVTGMQVNIVFREPDFSDVSLPVGEDTPELHARLIPFSEVRDAVKLAAAVASAQEAGCDTVVLEMKDHSGQLAWASAVPQAAAYGTNGTTVFADVIAPLKEKGLTVIAKLSVCADDLMAVRNWPISLLTAEGMPYKDDSGHYWLDPYSRELRSYALALMQELAALGFDEIWLDDLCHPSAEPENLRYSVTLRGAPNAHSAVCQLARKLAEGMQGSGVKLGVFVDSAVLTGEDSLSGQDAELFWRLFDRMCVYTTNDYYESDRSAALALGGSDARFVPAFSWSPSEAAGGYMVYIPEE